MCTVVVLRRPGHAWPLVFAANRDEMRQRPSRPPARHWTDRPQVIGGLDELAGGTWLALNDEGVLAGILNRPGSLGPAPGMRSRGELVLEALDHADAVEAIEMLRQLDTAAYRPFNMVVADNRDAYWIKSLGSEAAGGLTIEEIPDGLSMITARDRNDLESARIRFHLPRFAAAHVPDPAKGAWLDWERLLASREGEPDAGPHGAMNIVTDTGFGTLSSSLIALPALSTTGTKPLWRFADGHPDSIRYYNVTL